jgi:hypothetical protein
MEHSHRKKFQIMFSVEVTTVLSEIVDEKSSDDTIMG